MAILLTREELVKQRVENKYTEMAVSYKGSRQANMDSHDPAALIDGQTAITMATNQWEGTEGHAKVWTEIERLHKKAKNAAMLPDDWSTLSDLLRIDLTRRRMQEADYTSLVMNEQNNPAFGKSVRLDEFLDAGAIFSTIYGNNDAVPLLEHKTGATDTVSMAMFAVGDKTSLQDVIFNPLYDIEKVMRAVTRGYVGLRNSRNVLGLMVAKTTAAGWNAAQQQAADTTTNATKEELLYNTLVSAYAKLLGLVDPQTQQTIAADRVMLAIPYSKQIWFMRAINGQLNVGGKGKPSNFESLSWIDGIIPYRGDTIYAGKKTQTYAGVASTKAYMFVPKIGYTLTKRGLTMEQGRGSVLNLSQEERVWYGIQTEYVQEFFGYSYTGNPGVSGEGFCVEITLPTL
jgi:hypothetical protein